MRLIIKDNKYSKNPKVPNQKQPEHNKIQQPAISPAEKPTNFPQNWPKKKGQ